LKYHRDLIIRNKDLKTSYILVSSTALSILKMEGLKMEESKEEEEEEEEEDLEKKGRKDRSSSPFCFSLEEDRKHQDDDEGHQQHCAHCPQEPIHQALLDILVTSFSSVPVGICRQASEMENRGREERTKSAGPWSHE
jgi:hypothetical protein